MAILSNRRALALAAAATVAGFVSSQAMADVSTGPGGRGVTVGQSDLIGQLDYADTFTGTADGGSNPDRPYVPAIQPAAAYVVEQTFGNPSQNFVSQSINNGGSGQAEWSIASDTQGQVPAGALPVYPGSSGAGSATGFTQTGGNVDYGINYGLRTDYVVQVDAVASSDRIDITSGGTPGTIFQPNSLSVFFRGDGSGNASLYNGSVDTAIRSQPGFENFNTGLTNDGQWHNYAVRFDQDGQEIELFVDEASVGTIDLTTFAGGLYANFSNAAVGAGVGLGGGQNRAWTDNFQVGAPVPEPTALGLVGLGLLALGRRRSR